MVFSKSYCPHSKATKTLLAHKEVSFEVIELDQVPDGKAIQEVLKSAKFGGQRTVPNIFIAGQHIGGNSELQSLENKRMLDAKLALD